MNFRDEWKISIFGGFWNLRVGLVLDGRHAQRDRSVIGECHALSRFFVTLSRMTHVGVGVGAEKRGITVSRHAEFDFDTFSARRKPQIRLLGMTLIFKALRSVGRQAGRPDTYFANAY